MKHYFFNMRYFMTLCVLWIGLVASAQLPPTCYRISLSDKNNNPYSIQNPSAFLSQRAIDKRVRFNIPVTEQDLPINPQYVQQIKAVDTNIQVLCVSKWMNSVTIYCPDSTKLSQISALPFVTEYMPVANYYYSDSTTLAGVPMPEPNPIVGRSELDLPTPYDYGLGAAQIALHNGHLLHNEGFQGDGMLIAVFDAGWNGMDTSLYFQPLFENGQILGARDLLPGMNNVYVGHHHGTIVTSTMAMQQEGVLVGTAPEASYYLIRSENPFTEQLIEEDFWAQAAEIADSLGADVINSSLGYTTFAEFPQGDFTYADVDGVTSIASRAATLLAHRGVVVCISAGNEGANEWHYIGHPCDAFDVLAVGAADTAGVIGPFSSRGPSYDGRVKPDITSVGVNTACIWPGDQLGWANGTSLAGPVAAGLCACLWQSLPQKTSLEIMQIIRENSSCYGNPNDSLGYGIPDFYAAYQANANVGVAQAEIPLVQVFPNPCTDHFVVSNPSRESARIELFSIDGRRVLDARPAPDFYLDVDVRDIPEGFYVGRIYLKNGRVQTFKIIKQ